MNIYVGNIHFNLTNEDLSNLFGQFGEVTSAKIINDKVTGRSKGFGFVEMDSEEDGQKAIANLNDSEVMGRKLIVNEARPQQKGGGGGGFKKRSFGDRGGYQKSGGFRGNRDRFNEY
ncbi:MAG: RNA-binding protein [Chitinophagaceae bacterium]|jgi:RNA recognition motif-containing protein|nr:RNA-binding protein [Chitinophagaceae bacterium]